MISVILGTIGAASDARAQVPAPSVPDNGPIPTSPLGVPPNADSDGTGESVTYSSGALNVYIPLLSLPQRGGYSLSLGYVHHSNSVKLYQGININGQSLNGAGSGTLLEQITYTNDMYSNDGLLEINLPRLQYSQEYMGDYIYKDFAGSATNYVNIFCETNFVFTDFSGNGHPFENIGNCNSVHETTVLHYVSDSSDGSFYTLDTTDPTDMKVTSKSGTVYHFYGDSTYCPAASFTVDCSVTNNDFIRDVRAGMIADTNGNQIHTTTSGSVYTVTDTIGRTITIGPTQIAYKDSNGALQHINVTTTPSSDTTAYTNGLSCSYTGPPVNLPYHAPTVNTNDGSSTVPTTTTLTIVFPDGNGGQTKSYNLQFDDDSRLSTVTYPTGGYSSYQYRGPVGVPSTQTTAFSTCNVPLSQVASKTECRTSSGSCSNPDVTLYNETGGLDGHNRYFVTAMKVTRPTDPSDPSGLHSGGYETHNFATTNPVRTNPAETDIKYYDHSGNLLRSVHKTYPPPSSMFQDYTFEGVLPQTITTTLNDSALAPASSVTSVYDTYSSIPFGTVWIDNPTSTTETEYGGTPKKATTAQWNHAGAFSSNGHILDRPISKTVTDNIKSLQNTTTYIYDNGSNTVGNVTKIAVSGSNAPTATTSYVRNGYGQITQITDPLAHITTISYDDTSGWSNTTCKPALGSSSYPTSVKDSLNQIVSYTYNSCTGTIASITGPNPLQGTSYAYDALQRIVTATLPDGGGEEACYFDSPPFEITNYKLQTPGSSLPSCSGRTTTATGNVVTSTTFDGLGRAVQTESLSDPKGTVYTDTTYDSDGRMASVSNPYRSNLDGSYGLTGMLYDALDRKTVQSNPDGTSQGWSYSGNFVTFTDENLNVWQRKLNVAGQLTQVVEPSGTTKSPTMETDYSYDGLGNLWAVNQWGGPVNSLGSRNRSFIYDGMSRLRSATNAESGTTTYIYDANGNLTFKTFPAPNTAVASNLTLTTDYGYDSLNRIVSKTYTNDAYQSPWSCFQYGLPSTAVNGANQIGRLMSEWTQRYSSGACASMMPSSGYLTARKMVLYDSMGRVKQEQQCTPSNCSSSSFSLSNAYDLAGNLGTYTNGITSTPGAGSGTLTFTQGFGGDGRLQSLASTWNDALHPPSLFSAPSGTVAEYAPQGALQNAVLGNPLGTNITLNRTYDTRLRLTGETVIGSKVLSATPGTAAITFLGSEQSK